MTPEELTQNLASWLVSAGMPGSLRHHVVTGCRDVARAAKEEVHPPLPGVPLSEERLGWIRKDVERLVGTSLENAYSDRKALLDHVDYLSGLLHDLGQDGVVEHYRRGYRDGVESEQRRIYGAI